MKFLTVACILATCGVALAAPSYYHDKGVETQYVVVTKHGDCADCFLGVPKIQRRDTEVICKDLACTPFERKDKTSVHFKEI